MSAARAAAGTASILVVCTGNVCRSPAAEHLLRRALDADGAVDVRSAGTRALTGRAVAPPMDRLLAEAGCDPAGFTARQLTAADVTGADLVLTAERAHRTAVVGLSPAAVRRTFTLLEFADLARLAFAGAGQELPAPGVANRLPWLLARVPALRPLRAVPASDDIPDPFGRDTACFIAAAQQISAAVVVLQQVFLGLEREAVA